MTQTSETPGAAYVCGQCGSTEDLWDILQVGPATCTWACSDHVGAELHRLADRISPEFSVKRATRAMAIGLGFDSTKGRYDG